MQRVTPYIFPAIVILIVAALFWRWYSLRAERAQEQLDFGADLEIEQLSDEERSLIQDGVGDFATIDLSAPVQESDEEISAEELQARTEYASASGVFRYDIVDDRLRFSVETQLPKLESGEYRAWVQSNNSENLQSLFSLELTKAGYAGSAAVSAELLPFDVLVTLQKAGQDDPGAIILQGRVENQE